MAPEQGEAFNFDKSEQEEQLAKVAEQLAAGTAPDQLPEHMREFYANHQAEADQLAGDLRDLAGDEEPTDQE